MKITLSTLEDVDAIFAIYDAATAYQKTVNTKGWNGFEPALIEQEINENRHFKIIENTEIACTFVITFNDPIIWINSENDKAIYLHRIATHPNYRGRGYITKIVEWAITYAKKYNLDYIRMDTHSGNDRLNKHYINSGFTYKGISSIQWTNDLPEHYKDGPFSLFEIKV